MCSNKTSFNRVTRDAHMDRKQELLLILRLTYIFITHLTGLESSYISIYVRNAGLTGQEK